MSSIAKNFSWRSSGMNSSAPNSERRVESKRLATEAEPAKTDTTEEAANHVLHLGVFDIWAAGITIVIGGQYFCFNVGLLAGFGSYACATFLLGTSYVLLCICNAEITSMLPFAGGAYGLARVSLGLYWGFMVGLCEAVEYIIYVASSAVSLCNMILAIAGASPNLMPVLALIFYLISLAIHIPGGYIFWRSSNFLAIVSLGFVLIYGFGSFKFCDFHTWASSIATNGQTNAMFIGGMPTFMTVYPLAAWFYVGVESLNLGCAFVPNPRIQVGRGSMLCALTLFATSIMVLFVVASLPPLPAPAHDDQYVAPTDDVVIAENNLLASTAMSLNPLNTGAPST
jgi:hypothetical protein